MSDKRGPTTSDDSKRKCSILNRFIAEFKAKYPNLSSNQIASKLDVPQASLNRIENGVANPSLENILSIMVGTGNQDNIPEVLNSIYPTQQEKFKKIFISNSEVPFLDEISSNFATNEETFLMIQMAFTRTGITEEEIERTFGLYGVSKFKLLMDHGVLVRKDDGRIYGNQNKVRTTFNDAKKILGLAIEKCFDATSVERKENHLSYQTESVNKEGVKAILDELKDSSQRIKDILYNPEYYGDIRIFAGLVADRIVRDQVGVIDNGEFLQ